MKLYTNYEVLLSGDDPVQIYKNNGKKIAVVTLNQVKKALNNNGAQVVIDAGCKRFGFMREDVVAFIKKYTNENTDFHTFNENMNRLRGI